MQRDEVALTSSLTLGGAEGGWARYWDESSTVAVAEFDVEMPTPSVPIKEKKERKKKGGHKRLYAQRCTDGVSSRRGDAQASCGR